MPRRQTGCQAFKASFQHCEFKWLGLLLLYKSLINKSTDKDSSLKKIKKKNHYSRYQAASLNFLEKRNLSIKL